MSDSMPGEPRRRPRRRRRFLSVVVAGLALLLLVGMLFAGGLVWAARGLPVDSVLDTAAEPTIVLEALDGEPFSSRGPVKGPPLEAETLPKTVVDAVLSIEDRRFYGHFGVDFVAVARALARNWFAGEVVEGGSTITQQLAKMSFLESDRSVERKLREAFLALWIELRLDKNEILARYLNRIYLGSGVIGMSGAARHYFGKEVHDLSAAEAAMLAGMIQAPSELNPLRNPSAARQRAAVVIDAMLATGAIDEATALGAKLSPASPQHGGLPTGSGGWFADWLSGEVADRVGSFNGVMVARTTFHPELQQAAEETVQRLLAEHGQEKGVSQAAVVAMRPDGAVLAMVGGRDYGESQFNRAVQALRQPGSAFKLFAYLAALRQGVPLDAELRDEPIEIDGWKPENYGGKFHGRVTLAEAFARSLNAATVYLAQKVGTDNIVTAARDLGIDSELRPTPTLALGTSEVTLLDLTAAFASVRAGQMPVEPWAMTEIGAEGHGRRFPVGPERKQLEPLDHQQELLTLLKLVIDEGTGKEARLETFAAGKTGTSQDYRDAWFVGFTEPLVVGVWVGNDDASPMKKVVGGDLPAMIWREIMNKGLLISLRETAAMRVSGLEAGGGLDRVADPGEGEAEAGEVGESEGDAEAEETGRGATSGEVEAFLKNAADWVANSKQFDEDDREATLRALDEQRLRLLERADAEGDD